MPIVLNAFPLKTPELELEARQVPYDKETLDGFRATHGSTHSFRRQGDNILIFSGDGTFPVSGTQQAIALKDNFGIFFSLVKDGLTRHFAGLGRNPSGFNPIELVSARPEDNLLVPILGDAYPFKVCAKYAIDTRTVLGQPCLVIDCTTRRVVKENGLFFLNAGFDLTGRYVVTQQEDGYRKLLGSVNARKGETLFITRPDGEVVQAEAKDVYLEASRENFDAYILHTHDTKKDAIVEGIAMGAEGWIAGTVNAFPEEAVQLFEQARSGGYAAARELYEWSLPLLRMDTVPKFVQLIKLMQERVGLGSERVRAPRLVVEGAEREQALAVIDHAIATRKR